MIDSSPQTVKMDFMVLLPPHGSSSSSALSIQYKAKPSIPFVLKTKMFFLPKFIHFESRSKIIIHHRRNLLRDLFDLPHPLFKLALYFDTVFIRNISAFSHSVSFLYSFHYPFFCFNSKILSERVNVKLIENKPFFKVNLL